MDYKSKIREMVKEELLKFLEEEETLEEEELEEAGDVQYGEKHKSISISKKGSSPQSTFYTAKHGNQVYTRKDRKSLERLLRSKGFTRIT